MSGKKANEGTYLFEELRPHEFAFLALLLTALYCSQFHTEKWPRLVYGLALVAALPVFWWRCREELSNLPNRGFFCLLAAVWVGFFSWLGISTFQIIGSPSLLVWVFDSCSPADGDDQHGMLIPFVILVLLWWKRRELMAVRTGLWWPGFGLVAAGLLLHIVGFIIQQPRVSELGFFTGLYGLIGVAWGGQMLRAILFPYFLVVFCIPVGELGASVTVPLRLLVAYIVATVAQLGLAPDVIRQGTQLFDAQHTFAYEVAPACSGIRSLVAMLALSVVYAFVNLQTGWKRLLMVSAALPLAVLGNVVRLCLTIMVAEFFGQGAGKACETNFGFVTFAVAILCVIGLGIWLEASETKTRPKAPLPAAL